MKVFHWIVYILFLWFYNYTLLPMLSQNCSAQIIIYIQFSFSFKNIASHNGVSYYYGVHEFCLHALVVYCNT